VPLLLAQRAVVDMVDIDLIHTILHHHILLPEVAQAAVAIAVETQAAEEPVGQDQARLYYIHQLN